jgi:hypothetical protein
MSAASDAVLPPGSGVNPSTVTFVPPRDPDCTRMVAVVTDVMPGNGRTASATRAK